MGRQKQDKYPDSFLDNHHPDCGRSLFHIIKHHPLRHFMRRLAHRKDGGQRNAAGTVPAGRNDAFSADKRKGGHNLAGTRDLYVEEKVTTSSSVAKNTVRSQIKALIIKGISKKRTRHRRSSTCPPLSHSIHTTFTHDLEQSSLEDKLTHAMKHTSGPSPHVFKHFVKTRDTISMNKDFLLTFLQDPVCPLAYHFNKQQASSAKTTLTRSVSFPLSHSLPKKRGSGASISMKNMVGNGSPPKGLVRLRFGNKKQKSILFESSNDFWEPAMSSVAKWRLHGNWDINDGMMIVKDVQSSSGSAQGQNQKERKKFKNHKQKIEHVAGDSKKEKLRVTMDSAIDKIPQGHGISDDLKKEIFKKLTDPTISTKGEHCPASCNGRDIFTHSFNKHHQHPIRRISSLQEPLDSYCQLYENNFNTEGRHHQSEQLKLRTKEKDSPLIMLKPVKRILSLPDLQSFYYSYPNGKFSEVLSLTTPIMASRDGTMGSKSIAYQKRRVDLNNVHSKCKPQLDTPAENLIEENLVSVGENDLLISSNIEGSGSDSISEINGKVGIVIDDFGHSILTNSDTFNDQDIGLICEYEHKTALAASDSKSNSGPVDRLDNVVEQEANMDSLKMTETTENTQKVEILSKQLNYEIPHFHVDTRDKAEFNYVKYVLEVSGLTGNESISAWRSSEQPVDPLLYEEMEGDPDFCSYERGNCNHHVLFDLINEALLEIYGSSCCYYHKQLLSLSHIRPTPVGSHALHEVWTHVRHSLSLRSKVGHTTDFHISRDLGKHDGWMNLQLPAELVGLELEDLIFHDLLEEIMRDLACF